MGFQEFENQDQAFAPDNCTQIWNRHLYDETFRNETEEALVLEYLNSQTTGNWAAPDDVMVDEESFMIAMEGIKDGRPHTLLTKEHFAEMIKF